MQPDAGARGGRRYIDLRSFSSDVMLHNRVFGSPDFLAWEAGDSDLVLYLDSLDEALLRIDTIASFLADELPLHPTQRLSIRIACRTFVWPHAPLETALRAIWGEASVGVFELAPLRRNDVADAARVRGIDPERFMTEVQKANAVPFAIKPLTLTCCCGSSSATVPCPLGSLISIRKAALAFARSTAPTGAALAVTDISMGNRGIA